MDHILVSESARKDLPLLAKPTLSNGDLKYENELMAWRTTYRDHFPIPFSLQVGPDTDAIFFVTGLSLKAVDHRAVDVDKFERQPVVRRKATHRAVRAGP